MDDELLPLSAFSVPNFSAVELLKKRILISQGEISKLLTDYERAASIELVAIVNERYQDFLDVSSQVTGLSSKFVSLAEPVPLDFRSTREEIRNILRSSQRMRAELKSHRDTRRDSLLIEELIDACSYIDFSLGGADLTIEDLVLLVNDHERLHAKIEAIDAVLAEGRVTASALLRETIPLLREELTSLRSKLIHSIQGILDSLLHSDSSAIPSVVALYRCSVHLGCDAAFLSTIARVFIAPIKVTKNISDTVDLVESELLGEKSKFFLLATALESEGADVFLSLLLRDLTKRIASAKDSLSVFVPTLSTMDVFFVNFLKFEKFTRKIVSFSSLTEYPVWLTEFMGKFKFSIYLSLRMKLLEDRVNPILEGPVEVVLATLMECAFADNVIVHEWMIGKVLETVGVVLDRLRVVIGRQGSVGIDNLLRMAKLVKVQLRGFVVHALEAVEGQKNVFELVGRWFETQERIFLKTQEIMFAEFLASSVQTLESVKQLPALYRVASRGFPSRPSVYVELTVKTLTAHLEQLDARSSDDSGEVLQVRETIALMLLRSYTQFVKDVVVKEKLKSLPPAGEKLLAQLWLDVNKIADFFASKFITTDHPLLTELSGVLPKKSS